MPATTESLRLSRYNTVERVGDDTFIHGGLGGSLHRLPSAVWDRAVAFCAGDDDGAGIEDQLQAMIEHRLIVSGSVDELDTLEARYLRGKHHGGLGLTIVTSLGCNFDCPYCFESKRPSLLKPDVAGALIGLADDAIAAGTPRMTVTWMGGEPLLGHRQLFELSDEFISRCDAADIPYSATILTNGWHLTGDMAQRLAAARVGHAQVTIDGPADVHDAYRPKKDGGSSFDRIIDNITAAIEHLNIAVRVNLDSGNLGRVEELMQTLADRGLAGRVTLYPARLTSIASADDAPAQTYTGGCYSCSDYGQVEVEFDELAARHGFSTRSLPKAIATPCTAVRSTELVVGSDGELWKCWDDIGNPDEAIGTIHRYTDANDNMAKWLNYSPFTDEQCRSCIALPGCMGGCAHHDFFGSREDRCMSFRFNHQERVRNAALAAAAEEIPTTGLAHFAASRERYEASVKPVATPVTLGPTRRPVALSR